MHAESTAACAGRLAQLNLPVTVDDKSYGSVDADSDGWRHCNEMTEPQDKCHTRQIFYSMPQVFFQL